MNRRDFFSCHLPDASRPANSLGPNYYSNGVFTTHEGKKVRFYDDLIKGKISIINFMFASCHSFCPRSIACLAKVQDLLGDRLGRDIFMYSFSLKPDQDTPAMLNAYAKGVGARPGWLFLTGSEYDLTSVRFYTVDHDEMYYVSYRTPKGVFWTKSKMKVHTGEHVFTDGSTLARGRCGNRLSTIPQLPILSGQPTLTEMEFPGELIPPAAPYTPVFAHVVHSPPTPFIFVPPIIFPPGTPGTPVVPPIFFAANPTPDAIVIFLSIVTWLLIRLFLRRRLAPA